MSVLFASVLLLLGFQYVSCALHSNITHKLAKYEECLNEREQIINQTHSFAARAVVVQKMADVRMECFQCFNPFKPLKFGATTALDIVEWHYHSMDGIGIKDNTFIVSKWMEDDVTGALTIRNVTQEHTGFYGCFNIDKETYEKSIYFLDVVFSLDIVLDIENVTSKPTLPNMEVPEQNLAVSVQWSAWTGCDRCGRDGEDRRRGQCIVKPLDISQPLTPEVNWLLSMFSFRVPCQSSMVPIDVRRAISSQFRTIEQSRKCWIACPQPSSVRIIKEIHDGEEVIVDEIPPGEFTIKEGMPPPPEPVKRLVVERYEDERLIIQCPGNVQGAKYWMWENYSLSSVELYDFYKDRIIIDSEFRIIFKNLTEEDLGMYSCWTWDDFLLMTVDVQVHHYSAWLKAEAYIKLTVGFLVLCMLILTVGWKVAKLKGYRKA